MSECQAFVVIDGVRIDCELERPHRNHYGSQGMDGWGVTWWKELP